MAKYMFRRNGPRLHPFVVIFVLIFAIALFFFLSSFLGNKNGGQKMGMPTDEVVAETPAVDIAAPAQAQISGTNVNMRDAPSTGTGKVVHRFPGGESVVVLDKTRDADNKGYVWYKVRFESREGWVYGQYVKE